MLSIGSRFTSIFSIYLVPAWIMILFVIIAVSTPMHTDIGWLYYATKQWLAGDELYSSIYEINPPMIFILMAPVTYIESITEFSSVVSLRIYFALLITSVTMINIHIMKHVLKNHTLTMVYIPSLLVATFIMPYNGFSQRDHLAIIFILPYLLSRFYDLGTGIRLNKGIEIVIGIIAGVGICMKPYFLLFPLFCEIWCLLKVKRVSGLFSLKIMTMIFVVLVFYVILFLHWDDYIKNIIPWGLATYWAYGKEINYSELSLYMFVDSFILFAAVNLKNKKEKVLTIFLCFMSIPALLCYLLQAHYSYQLLPFKTILILNGVLTTYFYLKQHTEFFKIMVLGKCLFIVWASFYSFSLVSDNSKLINKVIVDHRIPTLSELGYDFLDESAYIINENFSGQPVYVLSSNVWPSTFITHYTNSVWVSGFPALWPLPAIDIMERFPKSMDKARYGRVSSVKKQVLSLIRCEIALNKPVAIFVDSRENPDYFGKEFKYADFFEQEEIMSNVLNDYILSDLKVRFFKGYYYYVYLLRDDVTRIVNEHDEEFCYKYKI
jgi:hypothetical protein